MNWDTNPSRVREKANSVASINSMDCMFQQSYSQPVTVVKWPAVNRVINLERCIDQTHPGPPYKYGGPLDVWKKEIQLFDLPFDGQIVSPIDNSNIYHAWGRFYPSDGVLNLNNDPGGWLTTWGDPFPYGATGWNKAKPGKPGADLAQFFYELRDLPRMFRARLRHFRDLGDNYLNVQFGWRPFLNDLRKFFDTTNTLNRRYAYLRNNNGKPIRKRCVVKQTSETTCATLGGSAYTPSALYYWLHNPGNLRYPTQYERRTFLEQKVWFEGKFQFWIPDLDSADWISRTRRQLYGLNLSPSVVWEIIPWSWLADWFGNLGDVFSNLSDSQAAEGLVAHYAFIMAHTRLTVEITPIGEFQYYSYKRGLASVGDVATINLPTYRIRWERKSRRGACPYGFALTWDGFSPHQLAILAALGISRYG